IALTLGRRPSKLVPRPLDALSIRARFDLALTLTRSAGGLTLTRKPIAVDTTPWRLQGLVGSSLYRSLRAAGAPAKAAEGFIKALATRLSIGRDVNAADSYDLVIERAHAATGETRLGGLLFAGLDQGGKATRLVRWMQGGHDEWFDADGQTERRGEMAMPVAGHITSGFGMRFHPILGFSRMHKGLDIGAPTGTPVYAVVEGRVRRTGWTGGSGNFIELVHTPTLATAYRHLSRIAVRPGESVRRGEVIGFVGSTGLSTGPHLHWEVWKNGIAVNPQQMSFDSVERLTGEALVAFKARVASLMAVKPGK
ncbi:M23 family metallopeptidase, partial [Sphingomonas bacterium]|uniref:M23 family metallopeptidase n=1 Tax=Sphingomonas bacterium TaxID=1895847 RepID=UPI001576CCC8